MGGEAQWEGRRYHGPDPLRRQEGLTDGGGDAARRAVFVTATMSLRALGTMNPVPLDLVRPPQAAPEASTRAPRLASGQSSGATA